MAKRDSGGGTRNANAYDPAKMSKGENSDIVTAAKTLHGEDYSEGYTRTFHPDFHINEASGARRRGKE